MFLIQSNIAQSFHSPIVRVLLAAIAIALLYVFYKEVRKIPAKLFTLMITAFIDMVGLLMIIPLLPFYVKELHCKSHRETVETAMTYLTHQVPSPFRCKRELRSRGRS